MLVSGRVSLWRLQVNWIIQSRFSTMPMISCTNAQMPWKKVITSNGRLLLTGPESSSTACGQIAWPLNLTHLQVHWVSPIHTEDSPTAVSKTVNMSKRDSVNTVSSRNSLCFIIVSPKFSHGITVYSNYFVELVQNHPGEFESISDVRTWNMMTGWQNKTWHPKRSGLRIHPRRQVFQDVAQKAVSAGYRISWEIEIMQIQPTV